MKPLSEDQKAAVARARQEHPEVQGKVEKMLGERGWNLDEPVHISDALESWIARLQERSL